MPNIKKLTASIQKVGKSFNLSSRTLRHWEDLGLIKSTGETYSRRFDADNVTKLPMIIALHESSLQLNDIKHILIKKDSNVNPEVIQEKFNLVSQSAALLLALCPHDDNNEISISETTLHDVKAICFSKWIHSQREGVNFYQECLMNFINDDNSFGPTYSIFCDYPTFDHKQKTFDYSSGLLMRVFIPIKKEELFKIPTDQIVLEESFFATKPEKFNGVRKQYVSFHGDHAVSVIFTGSREKSIEAYELLYDYIKTYNFTPVGEAHEVYLKGYSFTQENTNVTVRITVPVKKNKVTK